MMIPRDTNEYHTNRFCRGENFEKETRKAFFFVCVGGSFLFRDDDDGENERRSKRRLV